MRSLSRFVVLSALVCLSVAARTGHAQEDASEGNPWLQSLEWRSIGPARGGRATACCGVPGDPLTYYMGATGGGVWKTENAGLSWRPISDDDFRTGSVGAIAVAPSDPNVIYVGMGERDPRGNFSHGDGVHKSTDAGKTWAHLGLADTRQIGKIRIHPSDPDLVYVAALGHIYGPSEERGLFRSKDGGATWEKILYVNETTGAVDLEIDPNNPRIMYAGFWNVQRTPWSLISGGPGSGIWKSTDSGDSWEELTDGLPEGVKGKIGLAVSPVDSSRVYALIEAKDGGVYRSDDAGESWRRVNSDAELRQRAWYYTHIYADPEEINTVYVLNVGFWKSTDGGRGFDERIRVPHGDNHDLWINPTDNRKMVNVNDGGANVSLDGGESWTGQDMQPTAQFYHVTTDNQFPYRVYGAQQDNSTISVSSRGSPFGWQRDAYDVGGGESGYIAVHPRDSDIVYAGSYGGYLTIYNHETQQTRNITVWPDDPMGAGVEAMKYRFQWTFPIVISPHDPETVYAGGNVLFKSTNRGQSWEIISPDLTTDDTSKQQSSGGPITKDNTSVEYYCTIFTVAPSPHEEGVIWVGSDDGLVHLTRDSGETWTEVTPAGLGEWSLISLIECSPHDPATAYLAVNRYKMDDFRPYIFRTTDYGKTWKKITKGIAEDAFVRAVREDPDRRGLLYAGTETGVWVSLDDGGNWEPLQLNLPAVPITDLVVKEKDLVVATQGRSFWILDDLSPLHQLTDEVRAKKVHLFKPRDTCRVRGYDAAIHFHLDVAVVEDESIEIALEILDAEGELIKRFKREAKEKEDLTTEDAEVEEEQEEEEAEAEAEAEAEEEAQPDEPEEEAAEEEEQEEDGDDDEDERLDVEAGMNRFVWNRRYPDAEEVPGSVMWGGGTRGPAASPGTYIVRLIVGEEKTEQSFELKADPRADVTPEEYNQQFEFLWAVRNKVDEAHKAVNQIRSIRDQVKSLIARSEDHPGHKSLKEAAKKLDKKITEIEEAIIQTKSKSSQDPLNYPIRLNDKIATLSGVASDGFWKPTDQTRAVFDELAAALDAELAKFREVVEKDVPAFNLLVKMQDVPAIMLEKEKEKERGAEDSHH